jgi:adenylate cyclase
MTFALPFQPSRSVARILRLVAISAACVAVCAYADLSTHAFDSLERQAYGLRLTVSSLTNPALVREAQQQIRVVAVSDDSHLWAGQGGPPVTFIPRAMQAKLIDRLTAYGAKVIAFDMLFDTPQPGDAALAQAVHSSGRVLLACGDEGTDHVSIIRPEPLLLHAGCRIGHTRVPALGDEAEIDRVEPVVDDHGQQVPALAVEAVRMAWGVADRPMIQSSSGWTVPGMAIGTAPSGAIKVRYLYSRSEVFPVVSFESVAGEGAGQSSFYRDTGFFRNKIVLVGDTTRMSGDMHMTPLGPMPGVLIQAHAIATVLERRKYLELSHGDEFLLLTVLAAITALAISKLQMRQGAFVLVMLLAVFVVVCVWAFSSFDLDIHMVLLERGASEESDKTRMRQLLQRYVSRRIADYILKHPETIGGVGKRMTGTILFCDIRGFTELSEHLAPEDLVRRMNDHFQTMTEIVMRHDGTAASIVGDAMMALFGIPVPEDDHAYRAVAAAIEMQAAAARLQAKYDPANVTHFSCGIGINTGEVVVGEIGGKHLTNFTVYGLHVNIASRVEGLNKGLGTKILITRATHDIVNPHFVLGPATSVRVDGVAEPIEVFEVIGNTISASDSQGEPTA